MTRLRQACNAPVDSVDMSSRWSTSVMSAEYPIGITGGLGTASGRGTQSGNAAASCVVAHVVGDARTITGCLELLSTHLIVCDEDGTLLFDLALASIQAVQRRKETQFPSRSFAEEPHIRAVIELTVRRSGVAGRAGGSGASSSRRQPGGSARGKGGGTSSLSSSSLFFQDDGSANSSSSHPLNNNNFGGRQQTAADSSTFGHMDESKTFEKGSPAAFSTVVDADGDEAPTMVAEGDSFAEDGGPFGDSGGPFGDSGGPFGDGGGLYSTAATVSVSIEGDLGMHVTKAIETLWRFQLGMVNPREAAMLRSYNAADTMYALALLPLDVDCNLAQQITRTTVTTVERLVVLRIDEDFTLSIIFRPTDFSSLKDLRAVTFPLDKISLIWGKQDELKVCAEDGRIFLFTGVNSPSVSVPHVLSVFLANAATQVYRASETTKVVRPFSHIESKMLFDQYAVVDADLDGSISESEFMIAIGPILTADRVLPKALFSLFDYYNNFKVRMAEYLHACRVLLRGDTEDRLHFLFLLFDTRRESAVNYQQFLQGMKTLSQAISLRVPRGETIETWTYKIFKQIDTDDSDAVDFGEFASALTGDLGVKEALQSTVSSVAHAPILSFGHPKFIEITHILTGIQLSCTQGKVRAVSAALFSEKMVYNCLAGSVVKDVGGLGMGGSGTGGGGSGGSPGSSSSQKPLMSSTLRRFGAGSAGSAAGDYYFFNDYCPSVFHALRNIYGVSQEDYLQALGVIHFKQSLLFGCLLGLCEMSSSGRSGSFFYTTHDKRYVLKTIPEPEAKSLRKMLPQYYQHMSAQPNTLLVRFTGLHALVRSGGDKTYFVVMTNIFQNKLPIHETFDLKGSTQNRTTPLEQRGPGVALKDNDFGTKRRVNVGGTMKAELLQQLTIDSQFLSRQNLNDYSCLLGVHHSQRDASIPPSPPHLTPRPTHNAFQQFHGGVPTPSRNEVYFFGVIDILTEYNLKKMGEHWSKSVIYDSKAVSCVPPAEYHTRFIKYFESILI